MPPARLHDAHPLVAHVLPAAGVEEVAALFGEDNERVGRGLGAERADNVGADRRAVVDEAVVVVLAYAHEVDDGLALFARQRQLDENAAVQLAPADGGVAVALALLGGAKVVLQRGDDTRHQIHCADDQLGRRLVDGGHVGRDRDVGGARNRRHYDDRDREPHVLALVDALRRLVHHLVAQRAVGPQRQQVLFLVGPLDTGRVWCRKTGGRRRGGPHRGRGGGHY